MMDHAILDCFRKKFVHSSIQLARGRDMFEAGGERRWVHSHNISEVVSDR